MMWITRFLVRQIQKVGAGSSRKPSHLELGERGETEAYFYLQQLGYRIVATNFRAPHDRGEIDLIGWEGEVLCFIEVKTRTDDTFAPPSTAVTRAKQQHILSVAQRYLRHLPKRPACRFDVLSVVPSASGQVQFSLQKGAFSWNKERRRRTCFRDFRDERFPRFR
jgi:putative endonuclease